MPSPEFEINELVRIARSLFARGYSIGTAGNVSVRVGNLVYATPTGSSFETVLPEQISVCTIDGTVTTSAKPTKELPFHLAAYRARPDARAVVHLHSTYCDSRSLPSRLGHNKCHPTAYTVFCDVHPCFTGCAVSSAWRRGTSDRS
jgi:ribulose-5-phosphate 4-epimerase/fuculose-1-phosphate aldolase